MYYSVVYDANHWTKEVQKGWTLETYNVTEGGQLIAKLVAFRCSRREPDLVGELAETSNRPRTFFFSGQKSGTTKATGYEVKGKKSRDKKSEGL